MAAKNNDGTITLTKDELSALVSQSVQEELAKAVKPLAPPDMTAALAANLQLSQLAQLMKTSSDAEFQANYEKKLKELEADISLGVDGRSQKVCDQMYPAAPGDKLWSVWLNDRNGQPRLKVPAPTREDAKARYQHVCGINAVTDVKSKWDIAQASAEPAKAKVA